MNNIYNENNETIASMPVLALRGIVVLPGMSAHFEVGRKKSIAAINSALKADKKICLVTQRDLRTDDPGKDELHEIGTVAVIRQIINLPGENVRILVEGLNRARIVSLNSGKSMLSASAEILPDEAELSLDVSVEALLREAVEAFEAYSVLVPKISGDVFMNILSINAPGRLADYIASNIMLPAERKQLILDETDPEKRLKKLIEILYRETEILSIERSIHKEVRSSIEKNQREYYLREQIKAIYNELGESENPLAEAEKYARKIKALKLPQKSEELLLKEAAKLAKMSFSSPEATVARTYLDTCLELPWNKETKDKLDIARVRETLDKDHYGLEKVKERILEYLAVRKLSSDGGGQILCLVGPPGVGKTSIATAVSGAIGRKFARVSLGGVHDEAEIRGHRKTYIGSMPGRIINAFKVAGSKNPVILFDEIDKLGSDYRGDPASALLEVFDTAQNHAFRDHYIELPFDLSRAMFITTANVTDTIPRPLLDRMEIIHLNSYTDEEKLEIAKRHLIPRQIRKNGLKKSDVTITDDALYALITRYSKESGVRILERLIAKICRKSAALKVAGKGKSVISANNIEKFAGPYRYESDPLSAEPEIGIATGLAWTEVGGEILKIEVAAMEGTGKIQLTGSLGDVMKESANAAITYIRSNYEILGVDRDFYKNIDLHIHVPEGAVPKDGPSAGITMATAIISELTKTPVRNDLAMTGEITLRGSVLPIGGLNEKLSAAARLGIKTVLIPRDNKSSLEEVDKNVLKKLQITTVSRMSEVIEQALVPRGAQTDTAEEAGVIAVNAIEIQRPGIRQ